MARRAERIARSTSAGVARATWASVSSVAGSTLAKAAIGGRDLATADEQAVALAEPDDLARFGAGAYSQGIACPSPKPQLFGARSPSRATEEVDGRRVSVVIVGIIMAPGPGTSDARMAAIEGRLGLV